MPDERCETCRYWLRIDGPTVYGYCRRMPPTLIPRLIVYPEPEGGYVVLPDEDAGLGITSEFPPVAADEWCGEYQPADKQANSRTSDDQRPAVIVEWHVREKKILRKLLLEKLGKRIEDATLGDLSCLSVHDLEMARNCGTLTTRRIIDRLAAVGITLRSDY